jgi:hypothetical protein
MSWKNWSYVTKGIIIAVVVWLVLLLISPIGRLEGLMLILASPSALLLESLVDYGRIVGSPLYYIFTLVNFIIYGALIGWIIKKIKKK